MAENVTILLPTDPSPELVDRLRAAFPDASIGAPEQGPTAIDFFVALELAIAGASKASLAFPAALAEWWNSFSGGLLTLLWIAVALVAAYAAERLAGRLFDRTSVEPEEQPSEVGRLLRAMRWAAWRMALLVVFVVVARIAGGALLPADPVVIEFGRNVLISVVFGRVVFLFVSALAAPEAPDRRLMGFTESEAARVCSDGLIIAAISSSLLVANAVVLAAAPGVQGHLVQIALLVAAAAANIWFVVAQRDRVARLLHKCFERETSQERGWRYRLASHWSTVFVLFILVNAVFKALGLLGVMGASVYGGTGPTVLVAALALLGIAELRILHAEYAERNVTAWVTGAFALGEGAILVVAAVVMLRFWGIDPLSPSIGSGFARLLPALFQAGVVVAVGYSIWRAISAFLAPDVESDKDAGGDNEIGGEGSRTQTIRPILRGFSLALVVVTTTMMALSALGVNIGPLLASAGVFGLAIGFGAQKLVSDVISGLFYLYEDALRVGEYVVTDKGKGTVEQISIRSAKLRHQNGPIYTIPFSEMGTIQNHSRDFAVMKFSFMVPDSTDVEAVRKIVKKAGQELAADPELEGKLIAPLKSQGAISIQGKNYVIGCKFTTRPGDQFIVRRKAFAILQKALHDKGVQLSQPAMAAPIA